MCRVREHVCGQHQVIGAWAAVNILEYMAKIGIAVGRKRTSALDGGIALCIESHSAVDILKVIEVSIRRLILIRDDGEGSVVNRQTNIKS